MRKLLACIALSSCLFLFGCGEPLKTDTSIIYTMDTIVSISMYNESDAETHFKKIKEIFYDVAIVSDDYKSGEDTVSIYDLNKDREAIVSNTLLDLLKEALNAYQNTNGYFNPFIGTLSHKWKDKIKNNEILEDSIINEELLKIENTSLSIDGNKITINGYGNIDLGGIAKGYATAKAKKYLESEGISSYYIDAGHSSIALGSKNGDYLNVGLSKPYSNGYICKIKEKNLVISCSSPQNQYIKIDNNYYHHLLNPFTGYPSNTFDSVFVLNNNPMEGDYYSTALFNMSYSDCVNYSKENNIKIILYKDNSILYKTEGVDIYE